MKDALLKRFSPRLEFDSYEDFKQNFMIRVPDDFNFGYDVVDAWAELEPGKKALVWCNDAGEERVFTFNDVKSLSNRICNYLVSLGIRKAKAIALILFHDITDSILIEAGHSIPFCAQDHIALFVNIPVFIF